MNGKKDRAKLTFGICVDNEGYPASLELMKLTRSSATLRLKLKG
ncbi:MAG: hypothetical protein ACKVZH_25615 [Blastocatellia bacterium]